jgi:hypothetical protein
VAPVTYLAFWEDMVVFRRLCESLGHYRFDNFANSAEEGDKAPAFNFLFFLSRFSWFGDNNRAGYFEISRPVAGAETGCGDVAEPWGERVLAGPEKCV